MNTLQHNPVIRRKLAFGSHTYRMVLEELLHSVNYLDIVEVFKTISEKLPSIQRSTVASIFRTLENEKLVSKIKDRISGRVKYKLKSYQEINKQDKFITSTRDIEHIF